jgi:hypothetical protein
VTAYTYETTADEDLALAYMASRSGISSAEEFTRSVHGMLQGWVPTAKAADAPANPQDVYNAYLVAETPVQTEVAQTLGLLGNEEHPG